MSCRPPAVVALTAALWCAGVLVHPADRAGATAHPAGAQQAGRPRADAPHPGHAGDAITPTARKLNELFGGNSAAAEKGFESEDRAIFRKRFEVLDALQLRPGMHVADVGAGSGFFTRLMAERVGPRGTAYGVEVSGLLVAHIERTARAHGLTNVKAVLGSPASPNLPPASVDLVLVADAYHHFEYPREMLRGIKDALRPDGVLWLIDFDRIPGVSHPFILQDVRADRATFVREFADAGFELAGEARIFTDEYVLKFRHRGAPAAPAGARPSGPAGKR
ncbi:MAG: class I SAM-dependent methyltransferase [Vicinamibacterales bacterium]